MPRVVSTKIERALHQVDDEKYEALQLVSDARADP